MQARKQGNAQGIDVSHWNGVIDWSKVAASGISFAFIKATQNSVDKRFLENVKGAKTAGLLIGAYHYMDDSVSTVDQAKAAAQVFYKAIQVAGGAAIHYGLHGTALKCRQMLQVGHAGTSGSTAMDR
ncbi:glycoside hydrolase family 25 protein [Paenibacillus lutimineralis]|uniref:glycoside hydrolase family 25 protein n=1 Tax=Paenibacillus lutimineralis TaxID=2707005 RepID=UPI001D056223|nr:GH25 family lysozyme [Paenibacillus lutimineralis]